MKFQRLISDMLSENINRQKSILLLGARQTGKTTLSNLFNFDLKINLMRPSERRAYETDPVQLEREIDALYKNKKLLILIDEVQKVPELLDIAQVYIDEGKAQFVLTGSSARKLRQQGINLLPGRVVSLQLDPLLIEELNNDYPPLESLLYYGMLPAIRTNNNHKQQELDLLSYIDTYIEEEIRMEAAVRKVGPFNRFLELACSESNFIVNLAKLSKEVGVSQKTIEGYYQILEDCLIAERIEPLFKTSTRRQLTKSNRYLIFDLGVRRIGAKEGLPLPLETQGRLYEQFIGQQLIGLIRLISPLAKLKFWRDQKSGIEVDWVIENNDHFLPIEVKLTHRPDSTDCKHLHTFLKEYNCPNGALIICQVDKPQLFDNNILAISWRDLPSKIREYYDH